MVLSDRLPDSTQSQREIIAAVSDSTMTSPERILAFCDAVEYVSKHNIGGDIVECGVWKGGSTAAAARTLMNLNQTSRTLWMYDTYDGMSAPSASDIDLRGQCADELMANDQADSAESPDSIWCRCSLETVQQTMAQTGYPEPKHPLRKRQGRRHPSRNVSERDLNPQARHRLVRINTVRTRGTVSKARHWRRPNY